MCDTHCGCAARTTHVLPLLLSLVVLAFVAISCGQEASPGAAQPAAIDEDEQLLRSRLSQNLSPDQRLDYLTQHAMLLASKGRFEDALRYVSDSAKLLPQTQKAAQARAYVRGLNLPILYARRQTLAGPKPSEAVALDRVITLLLNGSRPVEGADAGPGRESLELKPPEAATPDKPSVWSSERDEFLDLKHLETVTAWLACRILEYGLTNSSPTPPTFDLLIQTTYRPRSLDLFSLRPVEENLTELASLLATDAALRPARWPAQLVLANERLYAALLTAHGLTYLENQKSNLCAASLARDYASLVRSTNRPALGPLITTLLEHTRGAIAGLEGSQKRVAELEAQQAALPAARTAALNEHAKQVQAMAPAKSAGLPAVPEGLAGTAVDQVKADQRKLAAQMQAVKRARQDLETAKSEQSGLAGTLEKQYHKLNGPKQLIIKNTGSKGLEVFISFYRSGRWHNADFSSYWTVGPGAEVRPSYAGSRVVCSKFKGQYLPKGAEAPNALGAMPEWYSSVVVVGDDSLPAEGGTFTAEVP